MIVDYSLLTLAPVEEAMPIEVPRRAVGCPGTTKYGEPCRAVAILPSGMCISHDPDQEEKRNLARTQGGAHTSRRWRLERSLKDNPSLAGVIAVLGEVTEGVKDGTVPAAVGNSVASLSRALIGAIEAAQSGEKLRSLEELLDQLTHERSGPDRSHPQAQYEDIPPAVTSRVALQDGSPGRNEVAG